MDGIMKDKIFNTLGVVATAYILIALIAWDANPLTWQLSAKIMGGFFIFLAIWQSYIKKDS
jgi:hypothetical protein